jgi:hypothetical protein
MGFNEPTYICLTFAGQAGYAAPVLLGHPMNREPARSWEPSRGGIEDAAKMVMFLGISMNGAAP